MYMYTKSKNNNSNNEKEKNEANRNIDLVAVECCESDESETKNEQYNNRFSPSSRPKNGAFVRTLTHAQLLI